MGQNTVFLTAKIRRNLTAPGVIKNKPGSVVRVICLAPGTIDLINDVTAGGAGASIPGFPATMVKGQQLLVNATASVGISAKTVSGGGAFNVFFS